MKKPCLRRASSLLELLIVVSIIGTLAGLVLPAVQRAREAASRIACLNNMRQVGIAIHQYHDVEGQLVPRKSELTIKATGKQWPLPWTFLLLPFIDQKNLSDISLQAYQLDENPLHNPPHQGLDTVIPVYICPSDGRLAIPLTDKNGFTAAYMSYLGVAGGSERLDGVFGNPTNIRLTDVTDGTSNTLMVGERPPPGALLSGWWYTGVSDGSIDDGENFPSIIMQASYSAGIYKDGCEGPFRFGVGQLANPCDKYHFWSLHPGGANFLFADGSARFLSYSAESVFVAMATRNGGEVIDVP